MKDTWLKMERPCEAAETAEAVKIVREIEVTLDEVGPDLPNGGGSYSERSPRLPDRRLPIDLQMKQLWVRRRAAEHLGTPYNKIDRSTWAWPPELEPSKPVERPLPRLFHLGKFVVGWTRVLGNSIRNTQKN